MKWDGRERRREEGGSEESEFAQAPDSRGSQLLKRTKLVRLFFQQGENFAIQKLDANSNLILVCATTCGPFAEWKIPFCQPPSSLPLSSLSRSAQSSHLRASAPPRCESYQQDRQLSSFQIILHHGLHFCGFDLSLFRFWQVQDDLLFVPPQSPPSSCIEAQ